MAALKVFTFKKKRFFQRGFKSTKNHTRGVKFLFVMWNYANFDLILKKIQKKVFKGFLSCFKVKKDILSARDILSAPTVQLTRN